MISGEKRIPSSEAERLCAVVADNLKKFIAANGMTQKELADQVGITAASMTDYCKARRLPTTEFFIALKKLYGISIDEFLTQSFSIKKSQESDENWELSNNTKTTYQKYCGTYFVYYFDTSKLKGRDMLLPRESLAPSARRIAVATDGSISTSMPKASFKPTLLASNCFSTIDRRIWASR